MITLVMPTYNRAHTLARALRSVVGQTRGDWELVIVDGASSDATTGVVHDFHDPRIRYIRERTNTGMAAARNRGLDEASGDWLGMLDSDDALVPHALETLLRTLETVSARLDAIGCNCLDGRTGRFTGHGLDHDRFLTVPLAVERARGEHWGIFHRRILGRSRFNPNIVGHEAHLWYRIHDGALWYYIHRGLRIYHRDGTDRSTLRPGVDYELCRQILEHDPELLRLYARWSKKGFRRITRNAAMVFARAGDWRRTLRALSQ
jgi:glycosyltransferase involved in cell wall biosynthesis